MYATRNTTGPLTFNTKRYYYGNNGFNTVAQDTVDGSFNILTAEQNNLTPSADYYESGSSDIINMKAGIHSVQVWGQMNVENQTFYSNLLYYIFAVAYDLMGQATDGITLKYSFDDRINFIGASEFEIPATQYEEVSFDWGYIRYVDQKQGEVSWYLRDVNIDNPDDGTDTEVLIGTYNCTPGVSAPTFSYIPTEYT